MTSQDDILKNVLESSPIPMTVTRAGDGVVLHCNALFAELVDSSVEEIIGRTLTGIHTASFDPGALIERLGKEGEIKDHEIELPGRNGNVRQLSLSIRTMILNGEQVFLSALNDVTRRMRAEEELQRFKTVLDSTLDSIFIFDPGSLRFSFVNRGAMDHLGYSFEELMGMTPLDITPEMTGEEYRAILHGIIEGREGTGTLETNHRRKDGTSIPVEIKLQYIAPEEEEPRFIAVVRDLTRRRTTEKRLTEGQQKYRNLIEGANAGIAIVKDLRLVFANQALAKIYGADTPEEFIGSNILELFMAPHEHDRILAFHKARMKGDEAPARYEFQGLRKGGELIWLEGMPRFMEWEGESATLLIINEISERKRAEEDLRRNSTLLKTVFDALPHPLQVKDREGRFIMVNKATTDQSKTTQADWIGKVAGDLNMFSPETEADLILKERQLQETGKSLRVPEYPTQFRNGNILYYNLIKEPLRNEKGEITGSVNMGVDITERVRAEQELSTIRERLEDAIESIPDGFALWDAQDRLVMSNQQNEKLFPRFAHAFKFGTPFEDIMRAGISSGSFPETLGREEEWVKERLEAHLNPGDPFEQQTADGQWVRILEKRTREGGIVGLRTDITQLKRVEEELRQSEAWLRMLLANSPVIIFALDGEGVFTLSEGRELSTLGLSPGEVVGQSFRERFSHFPQRVEMIEKALLGESVEGEVLVRGVWFQTFHQPLFDEQGEVTGVMVVSINVTKRKEAEDRLRASEARLRRAVEIAGFGTWEMDLATMILEWGEETREIYGLPPGANQGSFEDFLESLPEESAEKIRSALEDVLQNGIPFLVEHPIQRPDGIRRIVQQVGELLSDGQGRPYRLTGIIYDITERSRMEEELRQGQKMQAVGQLAGGVAHDFNNMLQIIQGYTELIDKRADSPDRVKAAAAKIIEVTKSAANITRQLLTFSRKKILQKQVLDLQVSINQIEHLLRRSIGGNVELRIIRRAERLPIFADMDLLEQILLNLTINARDAMPEGGRLEIETALMAPSQIDEHLPDWRHPGAVVVLKVSDTGCGIPPEMREQIFEPFFTTKELGKGTGLGLSTVYTIVEQLEGRITVVSEPEKGTAFTMYFPARMEETTEAAGAERDAPPEGSGTILFAEDETQVRELIVTSLEESGYLVFAASNGEEALELFNEHRAEVDLVVLDALMPKLSGRGVYDAIRASGSMVNVLFSTGYSSEILESEILDQPNTDLIQKPYSVHDLLHRVRGCLEADSAKSG